MKKPAYNLEQPFRPPDNEKHKRGKFTQAPFIYYRNNNSSFTFDYSTPINTSIDLSDMTQFITSEEGIRWRRS